MLVLSNWRPKRGGDAENILLEISIYSPSNLLNVVEHPNIRDDFLVGRNRGIGVNENEVEDLVAMPYHDNEPRLVYLPFGEFIDPAAGPGGDDVERLLGVHPVMKSLTLPKAPIIQKLVILQQLCQQTSPTPLSMLFRECLSIAKRLELQRWCLPTHEPESTVQRGKYQKPTTSTHRLLLRSQNCIALSPELVLADMAPTLTIVLLEFRLYVMPSLPPILRQLFYFATIYHKFYNREGRLGLHFSVELIRYYAQRLEGLSFTQPLTSPSPKPPRRAKRQTRNNPRQNQPRAYIFRNLTSGGRPRPSRHTAK